VIEDPVAAPIHHDRRSRHRIDLRIGPQPPVLHRVAAQQVAVEPVEPNQRGPRFGGHLQAVADRSAGMAHQHPVGPRPDIFAEQLGIAGKPAISDDDGIGTDIQRFAVLVRRDADDPTALQTQRRRSGAEEEPTVPLLEPPAQVAEQPVRAAPLPILSGHRQARRRQCEAMPADRAGLGERCTLAREPVDRAARIGGDRRRQLLIRLPAGLTVDCGEQRIRAQLHVVVGDVKNPAGPARAALVALVGAGFEHGRAQPQFGAPHRRAQPGEAAADRDHIEMHWLVHPVLYQGSRRCFAVARRDRGS
jgi:hypothetical protein